MSGRRTGLGLATGLAALVLTACSQPVAIEPADPVSAACTQFHDRLPTRVNNQEARVTEPQSGSTAAWGDPPIVVRCGVGVPQDYRPDGSVIQVDGIDWYITELSNGVRFTTLGLDQNVEVSVPAAYRPEVNTLLDLSSALQVLRPVTPDVTSMPSAAA